MTTTMSPAPRRAWHTARVGARMLLGCVAALMACATQAAATDEQISGWVRNAPDGRVEVEAEGDAEAMARFEQRIRKGPAGARVEHVEIAETTSRVSGAGFHIR